MRRRHEVGRGAPSKNVFPCRYMLLRRQLTKKNAPLKMIFLLVAPPPQIAKEGDTEIRSVNKIQSRLSSTRLSGRLTLGITPDYKEEYGRGGCVATKEGFKCKPIRLTQEFLKEVIPNFRVAHHIHAVFFIRDIGKSQLGCLLKFIEISLVLSLACLLSLTTKGCSLLSGFWFREGLQKKIALICL